MVHAVFHEADRTLEELLADEGGYDVLHLLFVSGEDNECKTCVVNFWFK